MPRLIGKNGSNQIEKFLRYEGHIERGLYKALAELQKLQILRSNRWISASDPSTDLDPPKRLTSKRRKRELHHVRGATCLLGIGHNMERPPNQLTQQSE